MPLTEARRFPRRINFNFLEKCNMACAFCYCPFDGERAGLETWKRIIDHFKSWDLRSITFGGGDPFSYDGFTDLLTYTKFAFDPELFVQVDTNGIGLAGALDSIRANASLLGIPLDGSSPAIHGRMRGQQKHFQVITELLSELATTGIRVKVNTLVSDVNIG